MGGRVGASRGSVGSPAQHTSMQIRHTRNILATHTRLERKPHVDTGLGTTFV